MEFLKKLDKAIVVSKNGVVLVDEPVIEPPAAAVAESPSIPVPTSSPTPSAPTSADTPSAQGAKFGQGRWGPHDQSPQRGAGREPH